jgi:hypothetical protein
MTSVTHVTYAIVAHSREQQLLRLVRVLRTESPNSSVVIHWDRESPPLDWAPFLELGNVFLVEDPVHPQWGAFEMVAAVVRSMRTAAERTAFDWFVLLSGQDYPVAPLERIERELADSGCDAFLDAQRIASGRLAFRWRRSADTRLGRRYYFAYWPLPSFGGGLPWRIRGAIHRAAFLVDAHQPFLALWPMPSGVPWRVGVRRVRTPFSPQRPCRTGSAWFNLSRRGVERVLERAGQRSPLVRHYRSTVLVDESFFHTLVCGEPDLAVKFDTCRFEVWEETESPLHPDPLTVARLDEMLGCGKHFARKFDQKIDSDVMDRIDEHRRRLGALEAHGAESLGA